MKLRLLVLALALCTACVYGQANGKLQIHFLDVGQGDGAILISPGGETVLFDDGPSNKADVVIAYLDQLGVSRIDYHIASHYHEDHIGCTVRVLNEFPLQKEAVDRGGSYKGTDFSNYVAFVGSKRTTAIAGKSITLDSGSANPVKIEFAALNGNQVPKANKNENDMSLVCVVRFGQFDAVLGGDLSGVKSGDYQDVETSVTPQVGQVEVYKVHHHGSRYSSNTNWLAALKPRIGIISCGVSKNHHPTKDCLQRLHAANVITYWTEHGNGEGVEPEPGKDTVGRNIIVECAPNSTTFTITHSGDKVDSYQVWNPLSTQKNFAWSKLSNKYHLAGCSFVENISPANLQTGSTPPSDKTLHLGCPK